MKNENFTSRYPSRASDDKVRINALLDEALFCTVSYVINGEPHALPTGFVRIEDRVYIHGSIKSRFLLDLVEAGKAMITVFIADGLVLAESAFDHSVNYRSVAIRAVTQEVNSEESERSCMPSRKNMCPDAGKRFVPCTLQSR